MAQSNPNEWQWYHHLLFLLFVAAFATAWGWLKPSDRVADIALAICAIVFIPVFTIIQIRKRRQRKV